MVQLLWYFIQVYWWVIIITAISIGLTLFIMQGFKNAKELPDKFINNFTDEDSIFQKEIYKDTQMPDEYSPENIDLEDVYKKAKLRKEISNIDDVNIDYTNYNGR
jgi:hypothetical protein